jgi:hypothetical protein
MFKIETPTCYNWNSKMSLTSHYFITFWYSIHNRYEGCKIMCVYVGQAFAVGIQYLCFSQLILTRY